jgi:hypothetical protein
VYTPDLLWSQNIQAEFWISDGFDFSAHQDTWLC